MRDSAHAKRRLIGGADPVRTQMLAEEFVCLKAHAHRRSSGISGNISLVREMPGFEGESFSQLLF
jgi:hypothetical protein